MPTVEKTAGGRVSVRGIGEFKPGDRAEVSDADAQYLVEERDDFELVDEDDAGDDTTDEPAGDEDDAGDDTTDEPAGDEDEAGDDTTGEVFDAEAWLDQHYSEREQAVRDGAVDAHLEEIREIETSETVKDAVDERLEG